jgi:two-component system, chemotaxis family, chemotaxis protein CheY
MGGEVRALIVDDSAVMRKVIERSLRQAGLTLLEVLQASNGEEALELLRQDAASDRRLNIILTDMNMPVMDGLTFLEKKRSENLGAGVPIVVITTEGSQSLVLGAIAAGARGYICKPFTPDQIKQRIIPLLHAA